MTALRDAPGYLVAAGVAAATRPGGNAPECTTADSVEYRFDPARTVAMLAGCLEALHRLAVPPAGDVDRPPGFGLRDALGAARHFTAANPEAPLDPAYSHMARSELLEVLEAGAGALGEPSDEDLVLSHGDPGLGSLCCSRGEAVGFAGWDGLAVADRHRDLAAAAASVATALGPMMVPEFFQHLSARPDPLRLDWWLLARQLTGAHGSSAPAGGARG